MKPQNMLLDADMNIKVVSGFTYLVFRLISEMPKKKQTRLKRKSRKYNLQS
jgi:hypothetical protein